jgi:DNA-binding MarR family transcriptional regulator
MIALVGVRGALRPSEISAALQLDRSTISRQIDAAARLGLVERGPDPADARAVIVRFTPETQRRMDELRAGRKDQWRTALEAWDRQDITDLTRLLGRLTQVSLS